MSMNSANSARAVARGLSLEVTSIALAGLVIAGCSADLRGPPAFAPEPGDEAVDPEDPPIAPDPDDPSDRTARSFEDAGPPDAGAPSGPSEPSDLSTTTSPLCAERSRRLSPTGLTFIIHVSKDEENGAAAVRQLRAVRSSIRERDIFMIEHTSPNVSALRGEFPCNRIDFIAYPDELSDAYDSVGLAEGIAVDWERQTFSHSEAWTIARLTEHARNIHRRGAQAAVVPWWPSHFDDARIVQASGMDYELAQIQNRCAHDGPEAFGVAARSLVASFRSRGLSPRDVGFEISLDSYADADNHTGVERSARCTRAAYGRGARAIYLYGNGHPHLAPYFRRIAEMGLREAR